MRVILAVDDENSGLFFRKLILEHAGFSVLSATGVDEALGVFNANAVDLVVTDLSGTSSIPEPLEHADAFLSKTEGPEKLLELVKRLLQSQRDLPNSQIDKRADAAPLQVLLAAIVEDSNDAILSKTLDGTILTWNKAAERMYGYRAEEIIGRNISVFSTQDRQQEIEDILQRLRWGEKIEHFETSRRTKDGRPLRVSLTMSPVRDAQGNVVAASTIARDITQSKMAEEALRNSERLAVAGRMAATIAHEINNPLEIVTNILYLLGQDHSLNQTNRRYVTLADEEIRRVGQITRTTLGLSRERDTSVAPVNLAELIESILVLYDRRFQSLGVRVEKCFKYSGSVPGVAGELRQVFSNLLANALDALTIAGTKLIVQVRESIDWADFRRRGIRVVIADDGPGMSREIRASLFQPFFTTKGQKGTGIGLWISQGIIAKHGGSIRLRSTPGEIHGTCFSVFLPVDARNPVFPPTI